MSDDKTNTRIVNIVATATTGAKWDLAAIASKLAGAKYDKAVFPGLIYKMTDPKVSMLLFDTGKIVCTGAREVGQIHDGIGILLDRLKAVGIDTGNKLNITVQNIVATHNLEKELNLTMIAITLGMENIEFEPEIFPGLVYRQTNSPSVMLLFSSGMTVCTGTHTREALELSIAQLRTELKNSGIL